MSRLSEAAKKATTMEEAPITVGREKVKQEELVAQYGHDLDIIEVGRVKMKNDDGTLKDVPCMVVAQAPKCWCSGGTILDRIISEWLQLHDGSFDSLNAELKTDPVKVRLTKETQKNNKSRSVWVYTVI